MMEDKQSQPADAGRLDPGVGRPGPERARVRWADLARSAKPVRCEICEWRGRRLVARSKPCPACGSRVEFA